MPLIVIDSIETDGFLPVIQIHHVVAPLATKPRALLHVGLHTHIGHLLYIIRSARGIKAVRLLIGVDVGAQLCGGVLFKVLLGWVALPETYR